MRVPKAQKRTERVTAHGKSSSRGRRFRVPTYFRRPARRKRRKIPARHVRAMVTAADSPTEAGGIIDLKPNQSGVWKMTIHEGKTGEIELRPDPNAEILWHTHPTGGDAVENARQQSPSPGDVMRGLEYEGVTADSFLILPDYPDNPNDGKVIHYSPTARTPPKSQATFRQLQHDYDRINRMGDTRSGSDLDKMLWRDREWKKLLKHKYHMHIKEYTPTQYKNGIPVDLKEIKD